MKPYQQSQARIKSNKLQRKVRRQHLQRFFKQKRSKIHLNAQIQSKFKDNENDIDSQLNSDEIFQLWPQIQQKINKIEALKQTSDENLIKSLQKLCKLVSLIIRQINQFNEFSSHKLNFLKESIQSSNQQSNFTLTLNLIWQIFNTCTRLICCTQSFQKISLSFEIINNFCQVMIQISYLKSQRIVKDNSLNLFYRNTQFYANISKFTLMIKQKQKLHILPMILRILYKRNQINQFNKTQQLTRLNQQLVILSQQLSSLTQQQTFYKNQNIMLQFIINLYYIIGNILSDYQPISFHTLFMSAITQNYNKTQFNSQFNNSCISCFYSIIRSLSTLRQNQYSQIYQLFIKNDIFADSSNIAQKYKLFISIIQIQIWLMRLFLIGGWTDRKSNSQSNKQTISQLNIQKISQSNIQTSSVILKLIHQSCIKSILEEISLLQLITISSTVQYKRIINFITQILLIMELVARQKVQIQQSCQQNIRFNHQTLNMKSNQQTENNQQTQNNQLDNNAIQNNYAFLAKIKQFLHKFISFKAQNKKQLSLINDLYSQLIVYLEAQMQTDQHQNQISIQNQLIQFVLDCCSGNIACSNVLSLPCSIIKQYNEKMSHHSYIKNNKQYIFQAPLLVNTIYHVFLSSIQYFVPESFHTQQDQMIQQSNSHVKTHLLKVFPFKKQNQSKLCEVLYPFIQSLNIKYQEQFYLNFILMIKECWVYENAQKNIQIRRNLVEQGRNITIQKQLQSEQQIINKLIQRLSNINKTQTYEQLLQQLSARIDNSRSQLSLLLIFPITTQNFLNSYLNFIVNTLSQFQQSSTVHLQALMLLKKICIQSDDQKVQNYVRDQLDANCHGIKLHFQDMAMWNNPEVNQIVEDLFQAFNIQ